MLNRRMWIGLVLVILTLTVICGTRIPSVKADRQQATPTPTCECPDADPTVRAQNLQSQVHIVRSGETLSSIARKYGVTVGKLREWNTIANPDLIKPGQKIVIWATPGVGAAVEGQGTAQGSASLSTAPTRTAFVLGSVFLVLAVFGIIVGRPKGK
jgi:hypothetical protein